tara:strand:+ start:5103 stop:5477 length:375 start_codon:yes stop_codon:yes gene_type:complete
MPYAQFDDNGNCIAQSLQELDGFEYVTFDVGSDFKKVDGEVALVTDEERSARELAVISADAAIHNRFLRDQLLSDSDWIVTKATESGEAVPSDWATYRQALRDLPTDSSWPLLEDADWPTQPSS